MQSKSLFSLEPCKLQGNRYRDWVVWKPVFNDKRADLFYSCYIKLFSELKTLQLLPLRGQSTVSEELNI
jgi:hypothetical protein